MGTYHYIALSMFVLLALLDFVGRGHQLAKVPGWHLLGTLSALSYFAIITYAPLLWDAVLGQYRLIPADTYPLWAQVIGGLFVYELGGLLVAPHHAQLRLAVAPHSPDAPQRRARRHLGGPSGSTRWIRSAGPCWVRSRWSGSSAFRPRRR